MEEEITLSKEQESTFNLINNTNINVFIQGQAGTGKSYFIKYLKEHCKKDMIFLVKMSGGGDTTTIQTTKRII